MWQWLFGSRKPTLDVLMYTRQDCHLCDDAWEILCRAARRHRLTLRKIDIDTDPALVEEHGLHVPVVVIDGRVRFRGIVNPVLLERTLQAG